VIVEAIEVAAIRNDRLGYELAWESLCNRGYETRRSLWRRSVDWKSRGALLQWMLFPSRRAFGCASRDVRAIL
jgi:hypothetical protein